MDVKTLPLYGAVLISGILAFENASVIFTGGVGKNGSTVAVRIYSGHYFLYKIYLSNIIFPYKNYKFLTTTTTTTTYHK